MSGAWVVWSYEHDAWWAPNRCGYTKSLTSAGIYTEAEAREIEADANRGGQRDEEARPLARYLRDARPDSVLTALLAAGKATGGAS